MEGKIKEKEVQLVTFLLNDEEFACDINNVREVLKMLEITPVPRAPRFVEGVINLRGEVVPVIDLRKRFDLPGIEYGEKTRVVIVEIAPNRVGMVVDAVKEVLRLPESKLQAYPSGITGECSELIKGVGKLGERLLVILNLEFILSTKEQLALKDIAAAGREAAALRDEKKETGARKRK